jgi:hypothetical protein
MQEGHYSYRSQVTYRLVAILKFSYYSTYFSDVLFLTFGCKLVVFLLRIFPPYIPEMASDFMSHIVQITSIISPGSCNHCSLACFL